MGFGTLARHPSGVRLHRNRLHHHPLKQLPKRANGLLAKARLPALFDAADKLTVSVLRCSTFRGEASNLRTASGRIRLDINYGDAFLLKEAQRHADRLLRHSS